MKFTTRLIVGLLNAVVLIFCTLTLYHASNQHVPRKQSKLNDTTSIELVPNCCNCTKIQLMHLRHARDLVGILRDIGRAHRLTRSGPAKILIGKVFSNLQRLLNVELAAAQYLNKNNTHKYAIDDTLKTGKSEQTYSGTKGSPKQSSKLPTFRLSTNNTDQLNSESLHDACQQNYIKSPWRTVNSVSRGRFEDIPGCKAKPLHEIVTIGISERSVRNIDVLARLVFQVVKSHKRVKVLVATTNRGYFAEKVTELTRAESHDATESVARKIPEKIAKNSRVGVDNHSDARSDFDGDYSIYLDEMKIIDIPNQESSPTRIWLEIAAKTTTKYLLMLRHVYHYSSEDSDIRRMIRLASEFSSTWGNPNPETKAKKQFQNEDPSILDKMNNSFIIGGATRARFTGNWRRNCYVVSERNFTLWVQDGYDLSHRSCLICDYIEGPLLLSPTLLTEYLKPETKIPDPSNQGHSSYTFWRHIETIDFLAFFLKLKRTKDQALLETTEKHAQQYNTDFQNLHSGVEQFKTSDKKFTETDTDKTVFELEHLMIFSCPDVMFHTDFTDNNSTDVHEEGSSVEIAVSDIPSSSLLWWDIGTKHFFTRIFLPEVSLPIIIPCAAYGTRSCIDWLQQATGYINPICCTEKLRYGVETTIRMLDAYGINYELVFGTALGGMKVNGVLSWERDGDFVVNIRDFHRIASLTWPDAIGLDFGGDTSLDPESVQIAINKSIHYCIPGLRCGAYNLWVQNQWRIELIGVDSLPTNGVFRSELPSHPPMPFSPTRVQIGSSWGATAYNPAAIARRIYGDDIFSHVEHDTSRIIGGQDLDPSDSVGSYDFIKCPKPGWHACLQGNYLTTGNLQFRGYWCN